MANRSQDIHLIFRCHIRNLITGMKLEYATASGRLYRGDCLELLSTIADESVATFFADPPFNLKKDYGSNGSDNIPDADYLKWCERWLAEGVRALAPGGALFIYNLPKWLMPLGTYLGSIGGMTFKHWIAIRQGPQPSDPQPIVNQPLRPALFHQGRKASAYPIATQ